MTKNIAPRYKLTLYYDLIPSQIEDYYNFVMHEMVPAAQQMELYMFEVYHTVWGDCPHRQAEFVTEDLPTLRSVLQSETWQTMEKKLQEYITNYTWKIIPFRQGFQL